MAPAKAVWEAEAAAPLAALTELTALAEGVVRLRLEMVLPEVGP